MRLFLALASLGFALAGCAPGKSTLPPTPPCTGDQCHPGTGGNISGGGSGGMGGDMGGAGGAGGAADSTGVVVRLQETTFSMPFAFAGTGVVVTYQTTTGPNMVGADAQGNFLMPLAAQTPQWMFANVTDIGSQAYHTHSEQDPSLGIVQLPVVDSATFTTVAGMLLPPVVVDGSKMHLIVRTPSAGVKLVSPFPGATVVYDVGAGQYDTVATETGPGGRIIVFNAASQPSFNVTVESQAVQFSYPCVGSAGAITILDI